MVGVVVPAADCTSNCQAPLMSMAPACAPADESLLAADRLPLHSPDESPKVAVPEIESPFCAPFIVMGTGVSPPRYVNETVTSLPD